MEKQNKHCVLHSIRTTDFLPKHDLFFGSPLHDPAAGIPLGDGDTGSLVWATENELHIQINKTDLWDDSTDENPVFCSSEEENLTCLRHGGEIVIRFPFPCFHLIYQKDYEARLSLCDATAYYRSETPFSDFRAKAFASAKAKVSVLKCETISPEPFELSVTLSRWGSRTFWRWYAMILDKSEIGLNGTESYSDGNDLYITQKLNGTIFCVGLRIESSVPLAFSKRLSAHSAEIGLTADRKQDFTLYYHVALGETVSAAKENCRAALRQAAGIGSETLYRDHQKEWTAFWNRSYVRIPDDYIENLYYLNFYYSNSECRGAYPPHFTSGIWGFQHDFMPWTYYFHYNMQHIYAPLDASGHGELTENYFRMRRNQLPTAYRYAKEVLNRQGAFYHDVTDRYGRGAKNDGENFTPAAQIAMSMWRHYRYTGDETFLREIAFPVMEGAAELYRGTLSVGKDGLYHIHGTSAYEANPPLDDTITDIAMMKVLFTIMAQIADGEKKVVYADIAARLPEPILVPLDEDDKKDEKFTYGIGKGRRPFGAGQVLAMGKDPDGKPIRKSHGNPDRCFYGFPDVELSLLYPSSLVGIKDRGSEVWNALLNQVFIHPHPDGCMQWCMMPIYLARMGLSEELKAYLSDFVGYWQVYPNGFNADCPIDRRAATDIRAYNKVTEVISNRVFLSQAYPFRHFDTESLPIVATAVNEMLLQSYDGIIRICPAVAKGDPVAFRLYAEGGFCVETEIKADYCRISVESLRGEPLKLKLPETVDAKKLVAYRVAKGKRAGSVTLRTARIDRETVLVFDLRAGERLIISDGNETEERKKEKANRAVKTCGNAVLGSPSTTR